MAALLRDCSIFNSSGQCHAKLEDKTLFSNGKSLNSQRE